jgi:hypothetical protein
MVPVGSATISPRAEIRRPPLRRTLAELAALIRPAPAIPLDVLVAQAAPGDGHAVLVLPPLGRGDDITAMTRTFLARIGYRASGWELGVNVGPTRRLLDGSATLLERLHGVHGPVSLLGFSLGGLFARRLALRSPALVRTVITVCSPVNDPAAAFWLPLAPFLGLWRGHDLGALADEVRQPLPVPRVVLFSRDDGIVDWRSCVDASCPGDCFEISGPHVLIVRSAQVMRIVAERLARAPQRPIC